MQETFTLLGQSYDIPQMSIPLPLQLLSAGLVRVPGSVSFEPDFPESYILLYTVAGTAGLRIGKHFYNLSPQTNNLLFLDCSQSTVLTPLSAPWEYQIFHFRSNVLTDLLSFSPESWGFLCHAPVCSEIAVSLEKMSALSKRATIHSALNISGLLYQVITSCIGDSFSAEPASTIPDYLIRLRNLFDAEYTNVYTLDTLALRFHVSKYKLCREFHEHFGCPPIQYLNRRRIFASKNLLLDPECKVYEAGCKVGIDNTNHYISLFKKYVGCTPAQFKQNHSV